MKTIANHVEGCMCPPCRGSRGARWSTKQMFGLSLEKHIVAAFKECARAKKRTISSCMEEAMLEFIENHGE